METRDVYGNGPLTRPTHIRISAMISADRGPGGADAAVIMENGMRPSNPAFWVQTLVARLTPFALGLALALPAAAQNWPQFRGPGASGVGSGDPPTKWNVETGENVKWKTRIDGLAHSSPASASI
jgi:hypothetical protein